MFYYYNFRIEILDTELSGQRVASPAESAIRYSIQGTLYRFAFKRILVTGCKQGKRYNVTLTGKSNTKVGVLLHTNAGGTAGLYTGQIWFVAVF